MELGKGEKGCAYLDLITVVERVPELGNEEQILSLYETLLDSTGNTLTSFLLVAVVWGLSVEDSKAK